MDTPPAEKVELTRTELDFLHRLLLELQQRLGQPPVTPRDAEQVAALELALALLRWEGSVPPGHDLQLGLGAAVEARLGPDAMCAYRQWRAERRRAVAAA